MMQSGKHIGHTTLKPLFPKMLHTAQSRMWRVGRRQGRTEQGIRCYYSVDISVHFPNSSLTHSERVPFSTTV